ncbi:MAG: T9SS type A sorting domain-containing protein [Bacteroidota bacterium]
MTCALLSTESCPDTSVRGKGTQDPVRIFKIDDSGNILWKRTMSSPAYFTSVAAATDGGHFTSGVNDQGDIFLAKLDAQGNIDYPTINGRIFRSEDAICDDPDPEIQLEGVHVFLLNGQDTTFAFTDSNGRYEANLDNGTYQVQILNNNEEWGICDSSPTITLPGDQLPFGGFNFQASSQTDCPQMYVSTGVPFLRRCFDNSYSIQVCNYGTAVADDVVLTLVLDPFMEYINASIQPDQIIGDTLLFDMGTFDIGECVNFSLAVTISCEAELGQTHCLIANVDPVAPCLLNPLPIWDGASIIVSEACFSDSIQFEITNIGIGDMMVARSYEIIRNSASFESGTFQLNSLASTTFSLPADGSTWRIEAEQSEGHPGNSNPSSFVEGCSSGTADLGFVGLFPQDDGNTWIDINCRANIGSYDPNDKAAIPEGVGSNHYIEANTDLEYRIRFQNTGTDTAFTIIVRDTLPVELDLLSLRMGASSHSYTYDILEGRVLEVVYENIMLPDSNVNEPASNGFFKFNIKQAPDLPLGTRIENSAGIYFDFNDPIITNTYAHEIAEFPFTTSIETVDRRNTILEVRIMPNPFRNQTRIEVLSDRYNNLEFWVYDALGQRVDFKRFTGNQLDYQQNHLPEGVYVYEIRANGERLQSGKLVVQ